MRANVDSYRDEVREIRVVHTGKMVTMTFCLADAPVPGANRLEIKIDDIYEVDNLIEELTRFRNEFLSRYSYKEMR